MAKTNKEIRWDLANQYYDSLREVEKTLEFLAKSWSSKEEIKVIRERLISNLQNNISNEEWYEESKKSHRAELKAKLFVKEAKKEKERLQKEYEEKMTEADIDIFKKSKTYEDAQVAHRWKVEDKVEDKVEVEEWVKKDKWLENLKWDTDAILDDLRKNYVKIEENVRMLWYEWKKVHINLPAVWNFEWFKFDYFVSNDEVMKYDFERKSQLEKRSYSINDVSKLLQAMNKYMVELQGDNDWDMDYENELKYWETETWGCKAWDCLKVITWLDNWYWLKDKEVARRGYSRALWYCFNNILLKNACFFKHDNGINFRANLFLKLSV